LARIPNGPPFTLHAVSADSLSMHAARTRNRRRGGSGGLDVCLRGTFIQRQPMPNSRTEGKAGKAA
jgi:hypothetical protein